MVEKIDMSGMEAFWAVHQLLSTDLEPDTEQWETLLDTPGYRALVESEFSLDFFPRMFSLAYRPARAQEREQYQDRNGFIAHYLAVQGRKAELIKHQAWLQNQCTWLKDAELRVQTFLPVSPALPSPSVACVIFHNDARGYQPIVLDLLATIQLGDFLSMFVAHEFHHHYRRAMLTIDWNLAPDNCKALSRVLDQIHAEGLADQIDKPALIAANHPFLRNYQEGVARAPQYLNLLQVRLEQVAKGELDLAQVGSELNEKLPMAGHYPGAYLYQFLTNIYGKSEVLASVSNPFQWYRLWLDAVAPQSPAQGILDRLEKQVTV